jgi:XTP/dITP diphosphohydrolase
MEILVATQNVGKMAEYQDLLGGLPVTLLSLADIDLGEMDVAETGHSFEENAMLKARAYADASQRPTLADDSGLCVDALDGGPGIYSARYAGPGASDADRRQKLLDALQAVPDEQRTARFECVIVLIMPHDRPAPVVVRGVVEGRIAHQASDGPHGFGYDPIFIPVGHTVTFADMPAETKHDLSHRGRAVQKLKAILKTLT